MVAISEGEQPLCNHEATNIKYKPYTMQRLSKKIDVQWIPQWHHRATRPLGNLFEHTQEITTSLIFIAIFFFSLSWGSYRRINKEGVMLTVLRGEGSCLIRLGVTSGRPNPSLGTRD